LVPTPLDSDYVVADLHRLREDKVNPTTIHRLAAAAFVFFLLLLTTIKIGVKRNLS
jgi:hypothetical protein